MKKLCLVTGANSGIGKAAAVQLAERGHHVVMLCRNPEKGAAALEEVRRAAKSEFVDLILADMSLGSSLRSAAETFLRRYDRLDVLINNAAIFDITQKEAHFTAEDTETFWATNHLGPVALTAQLWDALQVSEGGRVLTVASKGLVAKPLLKVDLDDPEFKRRAFKPQAAYYQSKLAQLVFTQWLARQADTVSVNAIRVPAVQTDVSKYKLPRLLRTVYALKSRLSASPEAIAKAYTALALDESYRETTGTYFSETLNKVKPRPYILQTETMNEVMALTGTYVDLSPFERSVRAERHLIER